MEIGFIAVILGSTLGLYWDNGNENGNYNMMMIHILGLQYELKGLTASTLNLNPIQPHYGSFHFLVHDRSLGGRTPAWNSENHAKQTHPHTPH